MSWSVPLLLLAEVASGDESFSLDDSIAAHSSLSLNLKWNSNGQIVLESRGTYVAWIQKGGLYVATQPHYELRQLVASDSTRALTAAYPSSDGQTLLYIREGRTPAFGPFVAQDDRELWRVDIATGIKHRLAQGPQVPAGTLIFAPDGRSFVGTNGAMLFEYRIGKASLTVRPLLKGDPQHYAARRIGSLAYSPDGRRLAFVSWRKAKQSYVGILDLATGNARYLDPSIYRDISPVWSPDGRELAFVRIPGNWTLNYRFSPAREGAPWSLLIADGESGSVRVLWQADGGTGSMFRGFGGGSWMEPNIDLSQIFWTPSGRILFPWEKTGWLSLYAIPAEGGEVEPLTPGEGEITRPTLSQDGRHLIYASNIGDIARLHLSRITLRTEFAETLTRGRGVEHSPQFLANGDYTYIANTDGRMPNRRMIARSTGQTLTLGSGIADESHDDPLWKRFIDPQVVPVRAEDGVTSYHLLLVPPGKAPREGFPVIVASKGGPGGRVSPGNGMYTALGQYAASRGYLFVEMNFRGCSGFGLDYRLPADGGAMGGSEVLDIAALARYLSNRSDVDPARIGIMGISYGGHIVSLALSRLPQYFAAGVHMSGVADWITEMKKDQEAQREDSLGASAPPSFIRLSERSQIEDLAFESSPASHLAAWKAPTLIMMGELDLDGHMESAIDLGYRLLEQGTPVEFWIAPDAGHVDPRAQPQQKIFDFFQRTLR